jgi:uncharacterized protein (TIGR00288 family)
MSEDANNPAHTDVAMFIDWENMHGFIRGKANVSALREVAESYGRFVLARAYADWREPRFQADSLLLYKIGFEPVYVAAGFKNNADVKLATDCIHYAYNYPHVGIFILVTGDGDFIHVASTLRPLGKKVIVIAQSSNASNRFGDLVDTLLIYDEDVNPSSNNTQQASRASKSQPRNLDDVFEQITKIAQEGGDKPVLLTNVKQKLIRAYGGFDERQYGFDKFKDLVKAGAKKSLFTLNTAGLRDWLTLAKTPTASNINELPDEIDEVFKDVLQIIQRIPQKEILLSIIKSELIDKYGGFDESVYGYSQFKELMQEGDKQNFFTVGRKDKQNYYVTLNSNKRQPGP